ncbi:MAG: DUF6600 domain-containing protein [Pyrinomonadaceae bacterium]
MNRSTKSLLAILIGVTCLSGSVWAGLPANAVNLPAVQKIADDDDEPEVKDRVARISLIDGDAKVRRSGSDDWETLTLNLPLVEGDEISTDGGARIEIQFDKNTHLRLDSNSYLKVVTLKDEGIAMSLSLGTMILRITAFDKAGSFFEIDAPKTTLAVQKSGRYRIDAGKEGDDVVRASVSDGGEARVYSDNAGFTLKDGRGTRIYVAGRNAGDWENTDASQFDDDFSQWVSDREAIVAKRLNDGFYDKYYDDDIYGAEDLSDNGDWINTPDYGYVWSPSRLALAQYSDWSPYRYGHWRWMSPFGWVWVNDEPWGWATYHHGRWFSFGGRWVWSPYGYYRSTRSWWSPAYVVINIFSNNVCWYPLGYHRRRYNYNWNHQTPRNTKVSTRPPRSPLGNGPGKIPGRVTNGKDPDVPTTGVVTVETKDFGNRNAHAKTAPPGIAKTILTKDPGTGTATDLPTYKERRRSLDIATERPKVDPVVMQTRVGAAPRKSDAPMDEELRTKRIFGGRPPQRTLETEPYVRPAEPRKTGAVERPPVVTKIDPVRMPPETESEKPRRTPPVRETPVYTPPPTKETPRYTPPPRETPRSSDPPKQTERTPRVEAPVKQAPKSDPPPAKSDAKPAERPAGPPRKDKPDSK